jgi:hypothetical protein
VPPARTRGDRRAREDRAGARGPLSGGREAAAAPVCHGAQRLARGECEVRSLPRAAASSPTRRRPNGAHVAAGS